MNARWQEIIQLFLAANEPLTGAQLSSDLQVSPKTVRNDIKQLNRFLQNSDAKIASFRGIGYQLETSDESSFQQFFLGQLAEAKEATPEEPDRRVEFLMERLLLDADYVKIEDLAEELYISRSTLQSDLKIVRKILGNYQLSLDQRPNYGIKVIGEETNIRFCISEFIFNHQPSFIEMIDEWQEILPKPDLDLIRNCILSSLRKHNLIISDISLQNLITHLAIAYKRIQSSNEVKKVPEDLHQMKGAKEFTVAKEIVQEVEAGLDVSFSDNEVKYLALHLQGTKLNVPDDAINQGVSVIDKQLYRLVKNMVKRIDEQYHFNLANDEELLLHLSLHLKPAINRHKYGMNIRNPLLEEIKTKYPLSFEAALAAAEVLDEQLQIQVNEHEIGYLALHIELAQERAKKTTARSSRCLIVCASGLGSAQLLLYKLKDKFGDNLEIVATTEYYNLNAKSVEHVDFIVSTIPIRKDLPVPVVLVSTILGNSDVEKIDRMMTKDKQLIDKYLVEAYTFFNRDFQTPEEVIDFLSNQLLRDGLVPDNYLTSVLERESYAPTSFGNLVAIPHPLEPMTDKTFWSIVTLEKAIQWDDKLVQIVFLLNIDKAKKEDVKPMFQALAKLVDNRKILLQLIECQSFAQLKQLLNSI
ncbi:BglG family transcription antiterminator [Sediminibacillus albus]|uniref:Lichenan operon transcriptional antiterminator n=1 Tax=Sediminibacillus albus TaxID=407036 RepID=A0A1G8Y540_9BACI|nr:BglG family transcription antiterminator [Sediminibacillus albus]SDJ97833.1 lichenan operon transcriptional antiterminator [Sediminibacillus albus]